MQDGGAEEVEGDRRHREDDHAEPGVELHDAGPAPGAAGPGLVLGPRAGVARVALLDAPVRIGEQLGRPDARDPERRERQRDRGGGTASSKPLPEIGRRDAERVHCRMSTLATVNSVTAATSTVVIFSSRR